MKKVIEKYGISALMTLGAIYLVVLISTAIYSNKKTDKAMSEYNYQQNIKFNQDSIFNEKSIKLRDLQIKDWSR